MRSAARWLCALLTLGALVGVSAGRSPDAAAQPLPCPIAFPSQESVSGQLDGYVLACLNVGEGTAYIQNNSQLVIEAQHEPGSDAPFENYARSALNGGSAAATGDGIQNDGASVILPPGATVTGPPSVQLQIMPAKTAEFAVFYGLSQDLQSALTPREIRANQSVVQCANDIFTSVRSHPNGYLPDIIENGYSSYSQCRSAADDVLSGNDNSVDKASSSVLDEFGDTAKAIVESDPVEKLISAFTELAVLHP